MDGMANRALKRHLVLSLSSVLTLFAVSTVYGLFQINSIGASLKAITESHIPLTEIITNIESHQFEQWVLFERALRLGEYMAAKAEDRGQFEGVLKDHEDYFDKVSEELKIGGKIAENAVQTLRNDEQRESFEDIREHLEKIAQEYRDLDRHAEEVFKLFQQGRLREAHALLETVEREEGQFTHELETFLMRVEELTELANRSVEQISSRGPQLAEHRTQVDDAKESALRIDDRQIFKSLLQKSMHHIIQLFFEAGSGDMRIHYLPQRPGGDSFHDLTAALVGPVLRQQHFGNTPVRDVPY